MDLLKAIVNYFKVRTGTPLTCNLDDSSLEKIVGEYSSKREQSRIEHIRYEHPEFRSGPMGCGLAARLALSADRVRKEREEKKLLFAKQEKHKLLQENK